MPFNALEIVILIKFFFPPLLFLTYNYTPGLRLNRLTVYALVNYSRIKKSNCSAGSA